MPSRVERLSYRETMRPTIIKTTRGKEPTAGVVVKTEMIGRPDREGSLALDDIYSISTFAAPRMLTTGR